MRGARRGHSATCLSDVSVGRGLCSWEVTLEALAHLDLEPQEGGWGENVPGFPGRRAACLHTPCRNCSHILHPGHDLAPKGADLVVCMRWQYQLHALHSRLLGWHGVLLVLLAFSWERQNKETASAIRIAERCCTEQGGACCQYPAEPCCCSVGP